MTVQRGAMSENLSETALRPNRAVRDEALAAVRGSQSPRSAWAALASAGVIPNDWVENEQRRFIDLDGSEHAEPTTLSACVALATDVKGILEAEELARKFITRLRPWGTIDSTRLSWKVWPEPSVLRIVRGEAYVKASTLASDVARGHAPKKKKEGYGLLGRRFIEASVQGAQRDAELWRQAQDRDDVVPNTSSYTNAPDPLAGTPIRSLPNPFEPAVELYRTGYAIDGSDERLVLVAPDVVEPGETIARVARALIAAMDPLVASATDLRSTEPAKHAVVAALAAVLPDASVDDLQTDVEFYNGDPSGPVLGFPLYQLLARRLPEEALREELRAFFKGRSW
jgi:hypothetical protein